MKKKQPAPRGNGKIKRKSAGVYKGCRYTMTRNGLIPSVFISGVGHE